jgi:hypothetical protein
LINKKSLLEGADLQIFSSQAGDDIGDMTDVPDQDGQLLAERKVFQSQIGILLGPPKYIQNQLQQHLNHRCGISVYGERLADYYLATWLENICHIL